MQDEGLVAGLRWGTEEEWRWARWSSVVSGLPPGAEIFTRLPDGTLMPIPPPPEPDPKDEDDDCFPVDRAWPLLGDGADRLTVTSAGWASLEEHLRDALVLHPDLARVSTLLKLGLTDTAVREAAVTLESMLRRRLRTDVFGAKLTALVAIRMQQSGADDGHQQIVSTRLRTVFKFVRNEYAHNVRPDLTVTEANALCWRISTLYDHPLWDQIAASADR